jgi:hypothetical protein
MRRYVAGVCTLGLIGAAVSVAAAPVAASPAVPRVTATLCTLGKWVHQPANVLTSQGGGILYGAAVATPTLAWAVGEYRKGSAFGSLIEKWTGGTSWSVVGTGGNNAQLYKVVAFGANSAFAVGSLTRGGTTEPLVARWNGSTWTRTIFSVPSGTFETVTGTSASDVWAVGWSYPGGVGLVLIEHWNGSAWTAVTMPTAAGPNAELDGSVEVAPGDIWIDGFSDTNVNRFWHYDGGTWTVEPTPPSDALLAGNSNTSIWMPGVITSSGVPLEHFTGSSWSPVDYDHNDNAVALNIALGATASTVWEVGYTGTAPTSTNVYIAKSGVGATEPALAGSLWGVGTGSGLVFTVGGTKWLGTGEPIVLASCD